MQRNSLANCLISSTPYKKSPKALFSENRLKEFSPMDILLKALGLLLYIVLFPLFMLVEICIDVFVFIKYTISLVGKVQFVKARGIKLYHSLIHHRFTFPWSFHK
jgi:hypothetical protein